MFYKERQSSELLQRPKTSMPLTETTFGGRETSKVDEHGGKKGNGSHVTKTRASNLGNTNKHRVSYETPTLR
jgi:hypothetical protein